MNARRITNRNFNNPTLWKMTKLKHVNRMNKKYYVCTAKGISIHGLYHKGINLGEIIYIKDGHLYRLNGEWLHWDNNENFIESFFKRVENKKHSFKKQEEELPCKYWF